MKSKNKHIKPYLKLVLFLCIIFNLFIASAYSMKSRFFVMQYFKKFKNEFIALRNSYKKLKNIKKENQKYYKRCLYYLLNKCNDSFYDLNDNLCESGLIDEKKIDACEKELEAMQEGILGTKNKNLFVALKATSKVIAILYYKREEEKKREKEKKKDLLDSMIFLDDSIGEESGDEDDFFDDDEEVQDFSSFKIVEARRLPKGERGLKNTLYFNIYSINRLVNSVRIDDLYKDQIEIINSFLHNCKWISACKELGCYEKQIKNIKAKLKIFLMSY